MNGYSDFQHWYLMYKTFKTSIVFTGLDVSKEVEVKETVEDVKEPEVIEKKNDSNIELVKVVASDIVSVEHVVNFSPIVTKGQLISKCSFGVIKSTKKPMKFL